MQSAHLISKEIRCVLDVLGPTVEFLTDPQEEPDLFYCMMLGTIPPGVSVPLHSHADVESFFVISGTVQVLSCEGNRFEWLSAEVGDFVHVPGHAKHAFRNTSTEPVQMLITTTPKIGKFFQEIGRPAVAGARLKPPGPDDLQRFAHLAASYGHWLGSPEENAALGICL
jgi:quercetin dioxygenase-like cupin family protein